MIYSTSINWNFCERLIFSYCINVEWKRFVAIGGLSISSFGHCSVFAHSHTQCARRAPWMLALTCSKCNVTLNKIKGISQWIFNHELFSSTSHCLIWWVNCVVTMTQSFSSSCCIGPSTIQCTNISIYNLQTFFMQFKFSSNTRHQCFDFLCHTLQC